MMSLASTRRRRAFLAVVAFAAIAVGASAPPDFARPVAAQHAAQPALLIRPVGALQPARRMPSAFTVPSGSVPEELTHATEANTVSFNTCTGNLVRDDHGDILGIIGAAHCVRASSNVMRRGHIFGTGTAVSIAHDEITLDSTTDMFYAGLGEQSATDVHAQLVLNYDRFDIEAAPANAVAVMTGYPRRNNQHNEPVTFPLTLGGIVHWPLDLADTIATFGNWNDLQQSCSPGASGSGLYLHVEGHGYVIIGVLSSRAEFEHPQSMPYADDYGLELRRFFASQLHREIDAEFICGFAPPTTP